MLASVLRRPAGLDSLEDHSFAETVAPPPLDEARESLDFWRGRLERTPRHRLGRRREARDMVARWEARVRRAEIQAFGGGLLGRLWATWDRGSWAAVRGEAGRLVSRRARMLMPRHVVIAALGLWATATLLAAAMLTALVNAL